MQTTEKLFTKHAAGFTKDKEDLEYTEQSTTDFAPQTPFLWPSRTDAYLLTN